MPSTSRTGGSTPAARYLVAGVLGLAAALSPRVARAQDDAASDAFMTFFYYSPYAYATTSSVHGFYVTPLGNYHLENVWMSSSS